jgi:hypothetical protein
MTERAYCDIWPEIFIFCKAFRLSAEHPQPLIQRASVAISSELRRSEGAFGKTHIGRAEDEKE